MKPKNRSRHPLGLIVVVLAALSSPSANAGNTWTGDGASTNWSDSANWGGAQPVYGTLTFTTGGTQGTTSIVDQNYSMNQLLWTGTSAWTLNNSNFAVISLYDNGGTQAKIENQSIGSVTINAPITFAATAGSAWGEINAVNGDITFGTGGSLAVNGSAVAGIKMFGSGRTTTFNNTVSATGKWFATTGASASTVAIGGAFTSGDIYLMNGSTLKLNSGGSITTSGLRLGGDFGTTLTQNLALGATFQLTNLTGGQSFSSLINTLGSNTSGALIVDSQNTSGTNTLSGSIILDSDLKIQQASGGALSLTGGSVDLKAQTLTIAGAGNTTIGEVISNSTGSGKLTKIGAGMLTLSSANTYTGTTTVSGGTLNLTGSLASTALSFNGGALSYAPTVANSTQTFTTTAFTAGAPTLAVATGSTLALGTISRTVGTGLLVDRTSSTGTVSATAGTGAALVNGVLPWALVKTGSGAASNGTAAGYNFATITGGNIVAYTGATAVTTSYPASSATTNYDWSATGTQSQIGTPRAANTIRFTGTAAVTQLTNSAQTQTFNALINAGGGLVTLGGGSFAMSIQPSTTTNELVLAAMTAGITINGTIINNGATAGAVTILGAGSNAVTFGTTNTFTGGLNLDSGTLSIASNLALGGTGGTAGAVALNGGTLTTTNTSALTNTHAITIGSSGGTLSILGAATGTSQASRVITGASTLLGSGALTINGNGALNGFGGASGVLVVTGANTYSGAITLQNGGILAMEGGTLGSAATVTLSNNSELSATNTQSNGIIVNGGTNTSLSFTNAAGNFAGTITLNANLIASMRNWYNAGAQSGTISGLISGTGGLTVSGGAATLTLSNANSTYSGGTTVAGGNIVSVGASSTPASGTVTTGPLGNGSLTLTNGTLRNSSTQTVANAIGVTTGTITALTGTDFTVNGNITGNSSSTLGLSGILGGSGLILGGNNSGFSGTATVTGANTRLTAASAGSAAAKWVVNGNLQLNVAGTNNFDLGELSSTVATGGISGHATNASSATSTLSVGALNTNSTFSGTIADMPNNTAALGNLDAASNNVLALTKTGSGILTLSSTNTYTGATIINAGTLTVTGSLAAGSAVAVNAGGTLAGTTTVAGTSTVAGAITLAGGASTRGTISLANGSNGTLSTGALTAGGLSGEYSQLNLDLFTSGLTTTADKVASSGIFTLNAGGSQITITLAGGTPNGGTYDLLTFTSGAGVGFSTGIGTTVNGLTLSNPNLTFGVTGALSVTSTAVQLAVTASAAPATAYWLGNLGTTWAANNNVIGNFSTDKAGTSPVSALPGLTTDVFFAATPSISSATLTNTLGQDFSIKSLTFEGDTSASNISGANMLTVGTGGITLASGNGGATLGITTLNLLAAQTWANASSNDLTVSANITGGSGSGLTINNTSTGRTVLSGANTYSGATAVNGGILKAGSIGSLSATSAYTLADIAGVTLDITGFNNSVGSLAGGGVTGGNVTLGAATLTAGADNTSTTYAGAISGTGSLTKVGAGAMILSGTNGYTGATTINAGTLTASGGSAIADTGAVVLANTAGAILNLANSETIGSLAGGGTTGGNVTLGANTLTAGGNNTTTIYAGVISGTGGALVKNGTGMFALTSANSYTGGSTVNGGTLAIGGTAVANGGALGSGAVAVNTGSILRTGYAVTSNANLVTVANDITLAGGSIFADDAFQHLSGTLNVTSAGTLGSTYNSGANTAGERDKGLFLDGIVSGTANLTLQHSGISTGSSYNTSIVFFTNAANTYAGTITVTLMAGSNTTSGGSFLGLNASTALQFATVNLNGNSAGLRFGNSPIVFNTGLGTATLGALSGSGNVVLTGYNETTHVYGTDSIGLTAGGNGADTTYSGIMSGAGTLTKAGSGTMTLSGVNTYTGATIVNGGTLEMNSTNATSASVAVNSGATLALNIGDALGFAAAKNLLTIDSGGTVTNITPAARVTIWNDVTMTGGTLTSTGAGDGNGAYSLNTQVIATSDASGNAATVSGGPIGLQNRNVAGGAVTFNVSRGSANPVSDLTVAATLIPFSGIANVGLTKTGNGIMMLTAINSYTGGTTVSGGILALGHATNTLADAGAITVNGGTLSIGTNSDTVGAVTLTTGSITGSTGVLTGSSYATTNGTISAILGGTGALTQSGSGTTTLSAANTYTGATIVTAGGTLALGSSGSFDSSPVITANGALDTSAKSAFAIASGQTLNGSGTVIVGNGNTMTVAGDLAAGNSPGVLTVSGGTTVLDSGSIFSWELNDNVDSTSGTRGSNYDGLTTTNSGNLTVNSGAIFKVILTGAVDGANAFWQTSKSWTNIFSVAGTTTLAGGSSLFDTIQVFDATSGSLFTPVNGSFTFTGSTLSWSAVPEPTTALAGLLLGAGLLRRRRSPVAARL